MSLLKPLIILVYKLSAILISALLHGIMGLFNLLDDEPDQEYVTLPSNYNYRTTDIDPIKRPDGLYDNH